MSNFTMGTISGMGFAQAQVHTNHSTSAEGTSAVMYARVPLVLGIYIFVPIQEIKHLIFGQIAMKEIGTNVNTRSRDISQGIRY